MNSMPLKNSICFLYKTFILENFFYWEAPRDKSHNFTT